MKRSIPVFLCLLCSILSTQIFAQKIPNILKSNLDSSLYEHFQAQIPHHFCPCNNCEHWYNGSLKIIKAGKKSRIVAQDQVEQRLTFWGLAGADQYSPFGSSKTTVQIYAEYIIIGKEFQLTLLKWKQNDCMKYQVLLNNPLDKMDNLEEVEDEVLSWALDAEEELDTPQELANPGQGEEQEGELLSWALDAEEGDLDENAVWEETPLSELDPDPNVLDRAEEPKEEPSNQEEFIAESTPGIEEVKSDELHSLKVSEEAVVDKAALAIVLKEDVSEIVMPDSITAEAHISEDLISEPELSESMLVSKSAIIDSLSLSTDTTQQEIAETEVVEEPIEEDNHPEEIVEEETFLTPLERLAVKGELTLPERKVLKKQPQARILQVTVENPTSIKFKDPVFSISFLTKTQTVLLEEQKTVYEYIEAGNQTTLEIEVSVPEHTEDFKLSLEKAVEVEDTK